MSVKANRGAPDRSPVAVDELLKRVQPKQPDTHDQSTILLVYRCLLSNLDAGSTVDPERNYKIMTHLILHNSISNVLREFTHTIHVGLIFLVSNCTSSLQNRLQRVFNLFKSSAVVLTGELASGVSTEPTRIGSSSVWIRLRPWRYNPPP